MKNLLYYFRVLLFCVLMVLENQSYFVSAFLSRWSPTYCWKQLVVLFLVPGLSLFVAFLSMCNSFPVALFCSFVDSLLNSGIFFIDLVMYCSISSELFLGKGGFFLIFHLLDVDISLPLHPFLQV